MAFPMVQRDISNAIDDIGGDYSWSTHPKGCFLHVPSKNVNWNKHPTGSRNRNDRQVCKSNGK